MRKSKGQEAVEFVFITALIFFAALLVMLIFGEAISDYVTNKSSVATTAKNTAQSYDTDVKYTTEAASYIGPIQTHTAPLPPAQPGMENLLLDGNIQLLGIPSDTKQAVITTGSSGATDSLTNALDSLVAQLEVMANENPSNPDLQNLVNMANGLSVEGHLVADAEEWFELAAQRLTSSGTLTISDDNRLCEFGEIRDQLQPGQTCDDAVSTATFIYTSTGYNNINNMLNTHLTRFNNINSQLQSLGSTIDDDQSKQITAIINTLSLEIEQIAKNVQSSVDFYNQNITDLESLNQAVASKTTDIKSELIRKHGKLLNTATPPPEPANTVE